MALRTLLVDNHDSFTYNLFHLLAEASGAEPAVLRNDEPLPGGGPDPEAGFDAVVLSPGPGHPGRERDFGICAEIVARGAVPTLGVCLGHQGLAHGHGGTVARAPEPVHGLPDLVHHDGEDLFAGLPDPFHAVRYHSLLVTDLPPELEATAWTGDGLLMGLRHRRLPQWGVQFHPESACSEHGLRLVANFLAMAEEYHASRGGRRRARRAASAPAPVQVPVQVPVPPRPRRRLEVLARAVPTGWDGEQLHARLFQGGPYSFWLDSSATDPELGRFSVLGNAAGPLARVARADAGTGTVTVDSAAGEERIGGDFLDWLDRDLADCETTVPQLPCDFALGWVGYLGYGLKTELGSPTPHSAEEDDAVMVFADRAVVLDHATGTAHLLALTEHEPDAGQARRWLDRTEALLCGPAPRLDAPAPMPPLPADAITVRHDRDRYLDLIGRCQDEIAAGETYEVCLTNQIEVRAELDPWQTYRRLRRSSPAPFAALLEFGRVSVLSSSPERFLRVDATGVAESSPIKGTRPRGRTEAEDRQLCAELATDVKDRAENLMILDLVRNDLGRCARPGAVEVAERFRVRTFARAHQLVSTVRARLRDERGAVDCVRACFPPGSMTGAPKERTMELIDRLEQGARGVYAGAIGYLSLTGAADLSVVIRTAVLTPGRLRYGTGGAVVALSDPEAEWRETVVKAEPLLALLGLEFPGAGHGSPGSLAVSAVSGGVPARR